MSKVTLIMTASVDGYVAKPDGSPMGATSEPAELKRWKLDRISRDGAPLMGRKTYEGMSSVWPTSKDAYAAPMNDIPKVVFSKSLKKADWPVSTIASGKLEDDIAALKRKRGGELIAPLRERIGLRVAVVVIAVARGPVGVLAAGAGHLRIALVGLLGAGLREGRQPSGPGEATGGSARRAGKAMAVR